MPPITNPAVRGPRMYAAVARAIEQGLDTESLHDKINGRVGMSSDKVLGKEGGVNCMSGITTRITDYHSTGKGWEVLLDWLATKEYPVPERYTVERDETNDLVPYTEGTWDEVARCANIGLLTTDEYLKVVQLAYTNSLKFLVQSPPSEKIPESDLTKWKKA